MQQPHALTEANTAPRLVAGQFEDADDDTEVEIVSTATTNTGPMVCKSTPSSQKIIATPTPFKSASSHHPLKTQSSSLKKTSSVPPRLSLERRISSSTTEATKALLAIAASAPPQQRRKKKTFVVRLEEIKGFKERHNGQCPPRRDPLPTDQPWEQSLLAWIQDCRRQFAEGTFSQEKAQALRELGCEGFAPRLVKPQAQAHPALQQALWFQRQQQEEQLMALQQRRAARMDPDGRHDDLMHPEEAALLRSQRLAALEELQMREQLLAQREAMMREQFVREQRMQQALQAQRRMSQGAMGAGAFGAAAQRMSLLDAVPSRADLAMSAGGAFGNNARMNALLMMQEQQRRASLVAAQQAAQAAQQQAQQQEQSLLRRPSDASGNERRPSGVTSSSTGNNDAQNQPRVRKTWDERMKEMWCFFLAHGHTQVQTRGEDRELGRWLSNTRCRLRDGLLPQHLAKEFLAMERWNLEDGAPKPSMEEEFAAARRRSSAALGVPGEVTVLATPPTQSKVKNFGGVTTSSPKGKAKRALPKSWHQSFTELQQFKAKFGHCDVKMIVNSPYGLLGKWLASQRSRHKLGQLPLDKVNRLREVGCNGFPETGGKGAVNRSQYRKDDEEAEFDQALRRLKSNGNEGEEDADSAMEDVPCSPATREKRVRHSYETRVEHIKAFREKHGHVKIRLGSTDKHEELLARWLASARSRYRGGQFKEERAAELRALGCDGFETNGQYNDGNSTTTSCMDEESVSRKRVSPARTATPSPAPSHSDEHEEDEDCDEPPCKKQRGGGKRQSFDDMLKELEQYQYVFGVGCSVPKPDGEKGKLGRWLAFQRRQFIAGKLSDERIEKLKVIGRKEFNKSALIVRAAERAAASIHIDQ